MWPWIQPPFRPAGETAAAADDAAAVATAVGGGSLLAFVAVHSGG